MLCCVEETEGALRLSSLTLRLLDSTWLLPPLLHLQKLVPQGGLLLFGFVRVQLLVGFRVRLGVGVCWVRGKRVRRQRWKGGFLVAWRHNGGSLVAADAEAALAGNLHQVWSRAGRGGHGYAAGAEGHAPYRPVYARALVLATSWEILPVLVNASVVFAGTTLCFCCSDEKREVCHKGNRKDTKTVLMIPLFKHISIFLGKNFCFKSPDWPDVVLCEELDLLGL